MNYYIYRVIILLAGFNDLVEKISFYMFEYFSCSRAVGTENNFGSMFNLWAFSVATISETYDLA